MADDATIHGITLLVDVPDRGFCWTCARGWADEEKGLLMDRNDLFRAASIGKMTCATMVMKLVEADLMGLDDAIGRYLADDIMDGLHIYRGVSSGERITIRQLLNHTSGLADYIEDGDSDGNGLSDFLELLIENPDQFWTPEETIAYTKAYLSPFFFPGQGFHYSDTNYQLLGLIVEKVTGKPLYEAYRELLFDPLKMNHSCLEFYEPYRPKIPGRGLSHVYFADLDYTDWLSTSADWAGGGIVTTTKDLRRFLRGFADDTIFNDAATKNDMLTWVNTHIPGVYCGLGIERVVLDEAGLPGSGEIWGHIGFPNSFMFYWPIQNALVIGTLNQALLQMTDVHQFVAEIITILENGQ